MRVTRLASKGQEKPAEAAKKPAIKEHGIEPKWQKRLL
jgi:hypothetical protein